MRVVIKTRDGQEVEFERKPKRFIQRQGESFLTALVRTYYPSVYREHLKMRQAKHKVKDKRKGIL